MTWIDDHDVSGVQRANWRTMTTFIQFRQECKMTQVLRKTA